MIFLIITDAKNNSILDLVEVARYYTLSRFIYGYLV